MLLFVINLRFFKHACFRKLNSEENDYTLFCNFFFRENKNRFLFGYLSSLVDLNVVKDVTVSYLMVGHTGNCVDQVPVNIIFVKKRSSFLHSLAFFYFDWKFQD